MLRLRSILPVVLSLVAAVPATAGADTAPVAAYGFEDPAAATTAGDASSYGNTGTLVGGAALLVVGLAMTATAGSGDRLEEAGDLAVGQAAGTAGAGVAEPDRTDLRADQA